MTNSISIRKLAAPDAEAWASLRTEALQNHPLAFGSSVPENRQVLIDQLLSRIGTPESVVFGAFRADSLIGICGAARHENLKEKHKSTIWGMYVAESNRRAGVAERLLRSAIIEAASWAGVELVQLSVSDVANEARALYVKAGFEVWGQERYALKWEGAYAGETHMVLDFRNPSLT